jgi:hypothetical protein
MRKAIVAAVLTVVTFAVTATNPTPAAAGGWAVTTLDPLAAAPVAGEPFQIGFMVRQHGHRPVSLPDVVILVTGADGVTERFAARPEGVEGHHVATVEVPSAGAVTWAVEQGIFGVQELGTLHVRATASGGASGAGESGSSPWTAPLFAVAAVLAALGIADLGRGLMAWRRRVPA